MNFIADTVINFSKMGNVWAYSILSIFSLFSTTALILFTVFSHFLIKHVKIDKINFKFILLIIFIPLGIIFTEFLDWKIFPWHYSDILANSLYFSQFANLIGVEGLSYLVFLYGLLLYLAIYLFTKKQYFKSIIFIFIFIVLNFIHFLYGYIIVKQHESLKIKQTINALVVQANIGNSAKLNIEERIRLSAFLNKETSSTRQRLILDTYYKLSKDNNKNIDIIFWPETAFPARYRKEGYYSQDMKLFLKTIKTPVVFGSYYGENTKLFNSVIYDSFDNIQIYKKNILLPFGEYMPLGDKFNFLYKWFPAVSHFYKGNIPKVFQIKNIKILPVICYEALFPSFIAKRTALLKPNLILHITNDSWFSPKGAKLHLLLSRMRAVENKIGLLRATNTGYSTYINPLGQIVHKTKFGTQEVMKAKIKIYSTKTSFYAKHGIEILNILKILYFLLFFVILFINKKRRSEVV